MSSLAEVGAPRVLLLGRNSSILDILAEQLCGDGFEIRIAPPNDSPLESLQVHSPEAVLLVLERLKDAADAWTKRLFAVDPRPPVVVQVREGKVSDDETLDQKTFAVVPESAGRAALAAKLAMACRRQVAYRVAQGESDLAEQAQQLASSRNELVDFASVVAHDLRSPLLTISGYCDLLQHEYGPRLDESANRYLRSVVDGTARMNRFIEELLDYAKFRCAERPTDLVELDVVLVDVLSNLEGAILQNDALVQCDPLPLVVGNRGQLMRLFQNLVDNAIKFRGPDRPVVRISSESVPSGHVVRVSDNGIGIDPEHQEAIFRILHRLPRSRELPGTGIGLAVCKKIVECHQGRIWIESAVNEGATFFIWFPGDDDK